MDKKELRTYFLPVSFTIELTEGSCLLKLSSMGLNFPAAMVLLAVKKRCRPKFKASRVLLPSLCTYVCLDDYSAQ